MSEAFPPFKWVVILYNLVLLALTLGVILRLWRWRKSHPTAEDILLSGGLVIGIVGVAAAVVCPVGGEGFGRLQLLSWMLFVHYPLVLGAAGLAFWRTRRRLASGCLIACLSIVAVGVDAFLIEPHYLAVTHLRIATDKVDRPLRVALLADIQTDSPGPYEAGVLRRVKDEACDLVLLAGDYIQTLTEAQQEAARQALNKLFHEAALFPILGIYAVKGNIDGPEWSAIFEDLPAICPDQRAEFDLGPVALTCLSVKESLDPHCQVTAKHKFQIVLGHCPNFSLGQVQADLLLAGHTHGGQVVFPGLGPLFTFSAIPRSWASGSTLLGPCGPVHARTLVVSRGIGLERRRAPRVRFLCRPQVVILDIVPEAREDEGRKVGR